MKTVVKNRYAFYQYEILDEYEAGVVLQGTEVKALKAGGQVHIKEAYVKILNHEAWLINCHIGQYEFGNISNHEEKRRRKLLLHKREIERLRKAVEQKSLTIVPLIHICKKGDDKSEDSAW